MCSVDLKALVDLCDLLVESLEKSNGVSKVLDGAHLSDAVHAQLRATDIDGPDAVRRDDGSDRRAAQRIVADDKVLKGNLVVASEGSEDGLCGAAGGVPLVGVVLDDDASADVGAVLRLVFLGVVRVAGVRHVGRHEERAPKRNLCQQGRWGRRRGFERIRNTLYKVLQEGRASSSFRFRTNLFVIEQDGDGYSRLVVEQFATQALEEGFDGRPTGQQVVESSGEDEIVVQAAQSALLSVEERQFKVRDVSFVDVELFGEELKQLRGVVVVGC